MSQLKVHMWQTSNSNGIVQVFLDRSDSLVIWWWFHLAQSSRIEQYCQLHLDHLGQFTCLQTTLLVLLPSCKTSSHLCHRSPLTLVSTLLYTLFFTKLSVAPKSWTWVFKLMDFLHLSSLWPHLSRSSSTCSLLSLQIAMSSANIIIHQYSCLTSLVSPSITPANKKSFRADPWWTSFTPAVISPLSSCSHISPTQV